MGWSFVWRGALSAHRFLFLVVCSIVAAIATTGIFGTAAAAIGATDAFLTAFFCFVNI